LQQQSNVRLDLPNGAFALLRNWVNKRLDAKETYPYNMKTYLPIIENNPSSSLEASFLASVQNQHLHLLFIWPSVSVDYSCLRSF
jgi:hypothetical protein